MKKSDPRTLLAWQSMRSRCNNERDASYRHYGGRGIAVCAEWADFSTFLTDMGDVSIGLSLDRKDVDDNYYPLNCRWATSTEQARNKTNTRWVAYKGEKLSVTTWAERIGLSVSALRTRLAKGWSVEAALTTPSQATPNTWRGPRTSSNYYGQQL